TPITHCSPLPLHDALPICPGLLGDKAHTMLFDNAKIKRLVPEFGRSTTPFKLGIREVVAWYDADPERRVSDPGVDEVQDRLIERSEEHTSELQSRENLVCR